MTKTMTGTAHARRAQWACGLGLILIALGVETTAAQTTFRILGAPEEARASQANERTVPSTKVVEDAAGTPLRSFQSEFRILTAPVDSQLLAVKPQSTLPLESPALAPLAPLATSANPGFSAAVDLVHSDRPAFQLRPNDASVVDTQVAPDERQDWMRFYFPVGTTTERESFGQIESSPSQQRLALRQNLAMPEPIYAGLESEQTIAVLPSSAPVKEFIESRTFFAPTPAPLSVPAAGDALVATPTKRLDLSQFLRGAAAPQVAAAARPQGAQEYLAQMPTAPPDPAPILVGSLAAAPVLPAKLPTVERETVPHDALAGSSPIEATRSELPGVETFPSLFSKALIGEERIALADTKSSRSSAALAAPQALALAAAPVHHEPVAQAPPATLTSMGGAIDSNWHEQPVQHSIPGGLGCPAPDTTFCPYQLHQSGTPHVCGVDCGQSGAPCCATWSDARCIPWSLFGPGEYVGPARPEHVSSYYLRVDDLITLTFISSRRKQAERYRIGVGDRFRIDWLRTADSAEAPLDRDVLVQPDGSIALPLVGSVTAAGKTVKELQDEVVRLYSEFQRNPQITLTPLEVNTAVQDVLTAVASISAGDGQQAQVLRVTPEGTIQAPGIGSVYVQGLTLEELRSELEARYAATFGAGLLVSPALTQRATSYVFIGGEVQTPGRYTLEGPTTVMQAIALAGGWNNGGNLRQVVIFRRDENWCLKATKIDIRAPLYGKDPCPADDVWLRDGDLVVVPKQRILCAVDVVDLYFTRGVYAVFPVTYVYNFSRATGVVPIAP